MPEPVEERIGLHNLSRRRRLAPTAQAGRPRSRVPAPVRRPAAARRDTAPGRGSKDRARFEGGQMPIHMRMRKLRGPHMKKSMPFEPFRTHTQAVNLQDLGGPLRGR